MAINSRHARRKRKSSFHWRSVFATRSNYDIKFLAFIPVDLHKLPDGLLTAENNVTSNMLSGLEWLSHKLQGLLKACFTGTHDVL